MTFQSCRNSANKDLRLLYALLLSVPLLFASACGGGSSNASGGTPPSNNPVPTVTSLSPASLTAGATAQTLTINGTGFLSNSTVTFNSVAHAATYVSSSQLTISLTTADLATAGSYPVVVTNPAPGGGSSTPTSFTVSATTGTLAISVVDLPSGANAAITVSGPSGFSTTVTGSQTLQNLAFGTYTVTPSSVHYGNYTYSPTTGSVSINIANTAPVTSNVDYYNVLPDTTKILDAVGLSSLIVGADGSTLIISGQSAVAQSLNPGDVLIVSPVTAFPSGKVFRVNTVTSSSGWYTVSTSPATLMDAYQQFSLSATQQLDATTLNGATVAQDSVRMIRKPKPDVEASLEDLAANPCANSSALIVEPVDVPVTSSLSITGTVELCPSIIAYLRWSYLWVNAAHLEVDLGETADLTATLSASTSIPDGTEVLLGTVPIPTPTLGVTPVLSLYAGASGSASASLTAEAIQTATGQVGFDYSNGTVTKIQNLTGNISPTGAPQVSANANIKAYLKDEFAVNLGIDIIDPYVSVSPFVSAGADTTQNPWWWIQYGADGEVGFHGAAEDVSKALGFDPSWSATIAGPYTFANASGPFQLTSATITSVGPVPVVGSSTAQQISLTGNSMSYVNEVILCASQCLNAIKPDSVSAANVLVTSTLLPGKWTVMTQDTFGNSNVFPFTVYPPPTSVSIESLSPTLPLISTKAQPLTFTGTGMQVGATITICFSKVCNAAVTPTVSQDGSTASLSSLLDHAGLWTAYLTNPDTTQAPQFSFNVSGPLSATVSPTGGIISSTDFQAKGSGASPGKAVVLTVTPAGGTAQTIPLTADQNGSFTYGPFSESTAGAYTLVFTDQTTGETSGPLTVVLSNGIHAQVFPASSALNGTPFTVSGWGATPGASILIAVTAPGSPLSATTTADSTGNFTFPSFPASAVGTYNALCEDLHTSINSSLVTWTVAAANSIQAVVSPQSGVVNSTAFKISGQGASSSGGVTARVTTPSSGQVLHAQASGGVFSFASMVESATGNYTATVSDDTTGSQSAIIGWTVNPDANTQLQTMTVFPTSWNPAFATGSTTVAVMPLSISGGSTAALNGTITSNQPWLLVDGHTTESWTAPESIALNVNPSGLAAGSYSATLTIKSSGASNPQIIVPVTVTVRAPLQVVTTQIPDILGGNQYSAQLSAMGGTGSGYKWSLVSGYLPYGIALDSATGVISGTAILASNTQALQFSVQAEDSSGADAVGWITVTYRPGLFVLIYSPSNFQFTVGSLYTSANSIVIPTQGGIAPISLVGVGMPPGLTLNSSSGLITGTPTKPGSYPVTFYAQDPSGDNGSATFTIQVVLLSLKITPATLPSAQVGAAYQQTISGTGGSQSGYTWSVQGSLPPGLQGISATGCSQCAFQISGTPTTAGSYTFTVNIKDSLGDTTPQQYTLIVGSAPPPQFPAASLPLATVGSSFSYSFSATAGTPPYTYGFVGSGPDPGLLLSTSGTLSGVPTVASTCSSGPSSSWYGAVPAITFQVKVTDANNQSAIQQFCMGTYYPTPVVTGITPTPITADGASHTITIAGSNFRTTSEVFIVGGSQVQSTYVDPGHLTITLLPSPNALFVVNTPSSSQVLLGASFDSTWIVQPAANYSNQNFGFTIADPVPTVTSVSAVLNNTNNPCTPNLLCQLIIKGTGLVFDTQYQILSPSTTLQRAAWPSTSLPWISVTTSSFSLPSAGAYTVVLSNPNQAGGGTATVQGQFTVAQ